MSEYVYNEIEKSYFKQKQALCFVFNKDNLTHSRPLFENRNELNAYQINIHQHLKFIHKIISNETRQYLLLAASYKLFTGTLLLKKRYSLNSTIFFSYVDLNNETMLLIKKRKVFHLILSFKSKLNET